MCECISGVLVCGLIWTESNRNQRAAESHRSGLMSPAVKSAAPAPLCHSALKAVHQGDVHGSGSSLIMNVTHSNFWASQTLNLTTNLQTVSSTITALRIKTYLFQGCQSQTLFETGVATGKNSMLARWVSCERAFPKGLLFQGGVAQTGLESWTKRPTKFLGPVC